MNSVSYDIAIRSVGIGGRKYQTLLDSIKALTPQPKAVYIILPEGKNPPVERLGNEKFVYTEKGMMTQRLAALDCCKSDYIFFCDDDISFEPDFISKLYRVVTVDGYDIAVGEILSFLPQKNGIKKIIPILQAAAVPTLFNKSRYVTILRSAGWSYNRFTPQDGLTIGTQSAAGAVIFTKKEAFAGLHMEDELWAQHGGIAPAEDQIMFYKADRMGFRIGVATDAHYVHLDSKNALPSTEAKIKKEYYSRFNRAVFWRRFIYDINTGIFGRFTACVAFGYYMAATSLWSLIRRTFIHREPDFKKHRIPHGFSDGLKFCKSPEYLKLPKVERIK